MSGNGAGQRPQGVLYPSLVFVARETAAARQDQPDSRFHCGLGLGRLSGRGRAAQGYSGQNLVVSALSRQHPDDQGQGRRHLPEFHSCRPRRSGLWAMTRPCCSTPTATWPKGRAKTSLLSDGAGSKPRRCRLRSCPALPAIPPSPCCAIWMSRWKRTDHPGRGLSCRRGIFYRHGRRGHADSRARRPGNPWGNARSGDTRAQGPLRYVIKGTNPKYKDWLTYV